MITLLGVSILCELLKRTNPANADIHAILSNRASFQT